MRRLAALLLLLAAPAAAQVARFPNCSTAVEGATSATTTVFGCPAIAANLVSTWPLSADGNDAHGANDLTDTGGVTFVAPGATPPANMPATVAEITTLAFFSVPDNASFNFGAGGNGFTIAFWTNSIAGGQPIIRKDDGGVNRAWIWTGGNWFTFQDDATFSTVGSALTAANQWFLVTMWFDPGDGKAHSQLDAGAVLDGNVITGIQDQAVAFSINSPITTRYSGVLLFSRVLTSIDRACLWNAGAGGFHPFSSVCNFVVY